MELKNEKTVLRAVKSCVGTVAVAFLITFILLAVLAAVICYTPLKEEAVTPLVYILNYLSVFLAGLFSAAKSRRKGFVTGAAAGVLYMLFLYLLGVFLFGGVSFSGDIFMSILYSALVGMAGGIAGINLKSR